MKTRFNSSSGSGDAAPRILAVDDDRRNLLALEAVLDPLGLEVVTVTSGEDALIEVLRSEFALILMDVQMPSLDGFATTALIKKRQKSEHIPIIFLSAISRDDEQIFQGYAHGAVDYLVKPFNPQVLRAKVGVFVELWTQRQIVQRQAREIASLELELVSLRSEGSQSEPADELDDGGRFPEGGETD